MEMGATAFLPLELCTTWPPHVTVVAGPWLDEAAARECAAHLAKLSTPFEVTLGPRVEVDGEGEDRAAAYSADQTLRAGWVEARTAAPGDHGDDHDAFMRLHHHAIDFLGKEAHQFRPHASLHYFESGELVDAQAAKMLDLLADTWSDPVAFVAPGVHVTCYLDTTPDEWQAIEFFPFTGPSRT